MVATNIASIGFGMGGAAFGAEVGLIGGPAGVIVGGLGWFGGLYGRLMEQPFDMSLYYSSSSNSSRDNKTGNNPNINWENPPKSAKSYAILCFLEGKVGNKDSSLCSWCLIDIPPYKRSVSASDYEGKKILNHFKGKEYLGPNRESFYLEDRTEIRLR